jgi:hypothetical protein
LTFFFYFPTEVGIPKPILINPPGIPNTLIYNI